MRMENSEPHALTLEMLREIVHGGSGDHIGVVHGVTSHHPRPGNETPIPRLVIPAHPVHSAMVHVPRSKGERWSSVRRVVPPLPPQFSSSTSSHHHGPSRVASHQHVWREGGRGWGGRREGGGDKKENGYILLSSS